MTIDQLLERKVITYDQFITYRLYHLSEDGIKWLSNKRTELFMAMGIPGQPDSYVLYDGMRNIIREIYATISFIQSQLEMPNA